MGNEPSIATLPESWHTILPSITRESVLDYSYRHRHRRSTRKSSSGSTSTNTDDTNGDGEGGDAAADVEATSLQKSVYLDDDRFDLDEHVPTALAILTAYPHLKDIRFKLVPGVLKEERYWECIFGILNEHDDGYYGDEKGIDDDGVKNINEVQDDYEIEVVQESEKALPPPETQSNSGKTKSTGKIGEKLTTPIARLERAYYESNANSSNTPPFSLDEIKAQHDRILQLEKSLREERHQSRKLALELHKERAKQQSDTNNSAAENGIKSCPRCNNSETASSSEHKGQWIMHPDCIEFMKLDDHLKQNLRSEKQKRVNEVLSQMKFILDTDEMKDSYGKWSCCGSEEYMAKGCKK